MIRRRNKIFLAGLSGIVLLLSVFALYVFLVLRQIPEAYAAWDTGTLVVEYMKRHDDRWPASWNDLVELVRQDSGRRILLRGASAGDVAYAESLRSTVGIDWTYDPERPATQTPITRPDGTPLAAYWDDPNAVVRAYIADRATTQPQRRN